MQKPSPGRVIKLRLIIIAILASMMFLIIFSAEHKAFIEKYYSEGLYPVVCFILHPILNLFPFSVGDLIYIAVVIYLIYLLIKIIRLLFKKEFRRLLLNILGLIVGIQTAFLIFYLFWGLNYFREPASVRLDLRDTSYSVDDLKTVTLMMIDSANNCRRLLDTADVQEDNSTIIKTATAAIQKQADVSPSFRVNRPKLKSSLISPLLNYLSTSGYYNPFTSEAQINYQMPVYIKPFVACHEISHQVGFAFEDEANFAGFLAGIRSNDKLLRYSAYYTGMEEFMHALRRRDSVTFKTLRSCISPKVIHDLRTERSYWLKYEGQISWLSGIFYNNYLKANNQPYGLDTYNQMIRLAMALYKKEGDRLY